MGIIYIFSASQTTKPDSVFSAFEAVVGYNSFNDFSLSNLYGIFVILILSLPVINYFVKDFSKTSVYIFTRLKSRSSYILSKQFALVFYCFISSLAYFLVKLPFAKFKVSFSYTIICFLVFFLFLTVFCSAACTFSLWLGTIKSFIIFVFIACMLCMSVTIYYLEYSAITQLLFVIINPAAHFMLNWGTELSEMMSDTAVSFIKPTASIIYFVILIIVLNLFSIKFINNKNIAIKFFDEE